MKPSEKKPETVFRIIDRKTGDAVGSYSRACHDEYDFKSANEARTANCHGGFEYREQYKIAKYTVTYTLIDDDCDKNDKFIKCDHCSHIFTISEDYDKTEAHHYHHNQKKEVMENHVTNVSKAKEVKYKQYCELRDFLGI